MAFDATITLMTLPRLDLRRSILFLGPFLALIAAPAPSRAQVVPRAFLELSSTYAADDAGTLLVFAPVAGVSLGFAPGFSLGLEIPVAVGHFSNVGALAALGNVRLSGSTDISAGPLEVEARIGLGVPSARPSQDSNHAEDFWRVTRGTAAAAGGLYDAPRWREQAFSLLPGVSVRVTEGMIFGGVHADAGLLYDNQAGFFARGATEVGVRPSEMVELNIRLQIAGMTKAGDISGPRIICIARTPEECNLGGNPDRFAGFDPVFPDGDRLMAESSVVLSVVPGVRVFLPPVELGLGLTLNLTDLVAIGQSDLGPGFVLSARLM